MTHRRLAAMLLGLLVLPGLSACGGDSDAAEAPPPIDLAYVALTDAHATAHVVEQLIERELGREVELHAVPPSTMWQSVAEGEYDALLAARLPDAHRRYLERYADRVDDLGPSLKGVRTGLVVPAHVELDTIADLRYASDRLDGRIVGINPDSPLMDDARRAIDAYSLTTLELEPGSDALMTARLEEAIEAREPIVVTGWTPHWMFAEWDLKYLDDPRGVFGSEQAIHTVARRGLVDDMPEVHALLDRFEWKAEDVQQVMRWNHAQEAEPDATARRWLDENPEKVRAWTAEASPTVTLRQADPDE